MTTLELRKVSPAPTQSEMHLYRSNQTKAVTAYASRTGYSTYTAQIILQQAYGLT